MPIIISPLKGSPYSTSSARSTPKQPKLNFLRPLETDQVVFLERQQLLRFSRNASEKPKPARAFWATVSEWSFGKKGTRWYQRLAGLFAYPFVFIYAVFKWFLGNRDDFQLKPTVAATSPKVEETEKSQRLAQAQHLLAAWEEKAVPSVYKGLFPKFEYVIAGENDVVPPHMAAVYQFKARRFYITNLAFTGPLAQIVAHEGCHALTDFRSAHLKVHEPVTFRDSCTDAILDSIEHGDTFCQVFAGFDNSVARQYFPKEANKEINPDVIPEAQKVAMQVFAEKLKMILRSEKEVLTTEEIPRLTPQGRDLLVKAISPEAQAFYESRSDGKDWVDTLEKMLSMGFLMAKTLTPKFVTRPYLPQSMRKPIKALLQGFLSDKQTYLKRNAVGEITLKEPAERQIQTLLSQPQVQDFRAQFPTPEQAYTTLRDYIEGMAFRLIYAQTLADLPYDKDLETKLLAIPLTEGLKQEAITATKRGVGANLGNTAYITAPNKIDAWIAYMMEADDERLARKIQFEFGVHQLGESRLETVQASLQMMQLVEKFVQLRKQIHIAPQDPTAIRQQDQINRHILQPDLYLTKTPDNQALVQDYYELLRKMKETLPRCEPQLKKELAPLEELLNAQPLTPV